MLSVLVTILIAAIMLAFLYGLDHNPLHSKRSGPQKFRGK